MSRGCRTPASPSQTLLKNLAGKGGGGDASVEKSSSGIFERACRAAARMIAMAPFGPTAFLCTRGRSAL